jgi:hypothetical protein
MKSSLGVVSILRRLKSKTSALQNSGTEQKIKMDSLATDYFTYLFTVKNLNSMIRDTENGNEGDILAAMDGSVLS